MSDEPEAPTFDESSDGERALSIPSDLPILPLRDTVLFPNSFMPLAVARESSVRLIDDAIGGGKLIAVFTQRDATVEEPGEADLFRVGTATHIHKMFKLPDGSLRLIVQGLARLEMGQIVETKPYLRARVVPASEDVGEADKLEIDALQRNIKTNFQQVVSLSPLLSDDLQTLALNISDAGKLADFIASSLSTISTAARRYGLAATICPIFRRASPWTISRRLPSGSLNILWMWVAVPTGYRTSWQGSSTAASRCVKTAISFPPPIASSIRRTEVSRATASGMNEFGKRTVSRSGRTGSSGGMESARSPSEDSSNVGASGSSLIARRLLDRRTATRGRRDGPAEPGAPGPAAWWRD